MQYMIRPATNQDAQAIEQLTADAFNGKSYAAGDEQFLAAKLAEAGSLILSIVAEVDGNVVGHLALSPATLANTDAHLLTLGPIAVAPSQQGKGIGKALIKEGLANIDTDFWDALILIGDPDYYRLSGFELDASLTYAGEGGELLQSIRFNDKKLVGEVKFHPAFYS